MRNGPASVKVGGRTHETRDACPATPRARQSKCLPVLSVGLELRESMSRSPQVLVLLTSILAWIDPRAAASALLVVPDQYPTLRIAIYRRKVQHQTRKNFQLDLFDPDD